MEIQLILETMSGTRPLAFQVQRLINAGYVGRNQDEVRRHIEELAAKGIAGPKYTPVLFPKAPRALVTDEAIDVLGDETSGEVEYVLLVKNQSEVYVGLGSDHTDRHLEEYDIPRSKQVCPNVMSGTVWPLAEVVDHWDELTMRCYAIKAGHCTLYQETQLAAILDPADLMSLVQSRATGSLDDTVIFSGTVAMLTGEFVFADEFTAELVDDKLGRALALTYQVRRLDYLVEPG